MCLTAHAAVPAMHTTGLENGGSRKKKAGQESVTCAELRKEFNAEKLDWMYESPKGSMDQAIKNFCQAKKRHYENPKQFGFPKTEEIYLEAFILHRER